MKQPELYARIQLEGLRGKTTWGSRILREATQANAFYQHSCFSTRDKRRSILSTGYQMHERCLCVFLTRPPSPSPPVIFPSITRLAEKVIKARLGPSLALLRHIWPPLWLKQATWSTQGQEKS
eukprot:COSAG02_NODE_10647_length_1892_cov_1.739543_2_plen_123_part_00